MNGFDHLHHEFDRLAGDPPDDDAVRSAVAEGIARREKRRRTTALVAVAASVALVAGGIGITRALTAPTPNSARPAAPVVAVPDVPLPADTQLVRHQLQPVVSPVSAIPPEGLSGTAWANMPGRLTAWWYRPAPSDGVVDDSVRQIAGYVVTDSADDAIASFDGPATSVQTVSAKPITIGGHRAMLELASTGAVDKMGLPATQRISWQLADGRYVRVFVDAPPSDDGTADPALLAFAQSITERPVTLARTVGIGLTLPGHTEDVTSNVSPIGYGSGGSILLCPEGVDPYDRTAAGSGSDAVQTSPESPPSSGSASGSASAALGETTYSIEPDPENPLARCITVFVVNAATLDSTGTTGTRVTVAGTTVRVDTDSNTARKLLKPNLLVAVAAPPATPLSADDLAALAASVRLSPDVVVADSTGFSAAIGSSSAAAATAVTSSMASSADPSTAHPQVDVLNDARHPVSISAEPGVIEFSVQNTTDQSVVIDGFTSGGAAVADNGTVAPGVTLSSVQVRLDNLPTDADTPWAAAVFPAMLAPHAVVRFHLEFAVDKCAAQPTDPALPLSLEYHGGDSGGSFTGGLAVSSYWGDWATTLRAPYCELGTSPH